MQRLQYEGRIYPKEFDKYLQSIYEATLKEIKAEPSNRLLYLDVSYLYTFHLSDVMYVRKFTDIIRISEIIVKEGNRYVRRNPKAIEWMEILEKWHIGEYADVCGHKMKPIQIERSFDRVTNELMEQVAAGLAGAEFFPPMKFHARGDGAEAGTTPAPSDTALVEELDRIDVTAEVGGGGVTVDGSTFMNVGNFDPFSPSGDDTESGIFDAEKPAGGDEGEVVIDDHMGDHSIFPNEVPHISGDDAPGSTTVIYQCSS